MDGHDRKLDKTNFRILGCCISNSRNNVKFFHFLSNLHMLVAILNNYFQNFLMFVKIATQNSIQFQRDGWT